ncbi:hypothetical protein XENOCAPTIV_015562 [Xenoophorus captivus]|uniref:Uncharacterized protein n=1 Tax=Xenoophorus captivus TaxID=1517983 RepID=A0ABV0QND1_9TELE
MPPSGGVPGMFHQEEAQGLAQDMLEGLCLSTSLGTPWASPGGAGGGVWGEGSLGVSTQSAAPATRFRIKRKTMSTSLKSILCIYMLIRSTFHYFGVCLDHLCVHSGLNISPLLFAKNLKLSQVG